MRLPNDTTTQRSCCWSGRGRQQCEGDTVEARPKCIGKSAGRPSKYDITTTTVKRNGWKRGSCSYHLAAGHRREKGHDVVRLLEEHLYPLHATVTAGDVNAMARFLDDGAEVDEAQVTARLLFVASSFAASLVRLLIDGRGVDRATITARRR